MTDITLRAPAHPTPESQLVRVFAGTIGGLPANVCDARELHAYLEVGRDFANWLNERIEKYGFQQDQDFTVCSPDRASKKRGGHNRKDYHLCLDMAKELSMVENNERGREARRYFIQKEREALAALGQHVPAPHTETLLPSEQQTLSEIVHRKTEHFGALQGKALAEAWSRLHRKFRVAKYSQLPRTQLADAILYVTQMEMRTAGGIPPQAAREQISSRDHHAIRRVVWFIANSFGGGENWTQGIWAHLRAALDHPAPQPFYVDQLPRIAETMSAVMRDASATSALMRKIQGDAIRRILRKGESADAVMADLAREAAAHDAQCKQLLPELPRWFAKDIQSIADRSIPVDYSNESAEERRAA